MHLDSLYHGLATSSVGTVAAAAEERKLAKYTSLDHGHSFTPVAIETLVEVFGPNLVAFIKDLGPRIHQRADEVKYLAYLLQRLPVAAQKGNSVSILGSIGK